MFTGEVDKFTRWFYTQGNHISFLVKACSAAEVILTQNPLQTDGQQYEIGIGQNGNTYSFIKYNGVVEASIDKEDLLSCHR